MAFHPDQILTELPDREANYHVAFSGGLDSHVLLHALASLRDAGKLDGTLKAIHINHGLNVNADQWAEHCRQVCHQLKVPLDSTEVEVRRQGQGLEQAAREARYSVFSQVMQTDRDVLLTAHHQDDQVETLLFRMLRGTGLRGLGGIRRQRKLGSGTILRPMLDTMRADLLAYAQAQGLSWITDDSNADVSLDRNYLRHRVLPVLSERWPGYRKSLQRLGEFAGQAQSLMTEIGEQDLAQVRDGLHRLSIDALKQFSQARQYNVVRSWFLDLEASHGIPAPDAYVTERVFTELIPAAGDAEPLISWHKEDQLVEIRRFGDRIYVVLPDESLQMPATLTWQAESPLALPGNGTLSLEEAADEGFVLPEDGKLEIRFRQGGEAAKPAGRRTRSLKKVLQDYQVPPWLRSRMPLVYLDGELLAVGDLFVTDRWRVLARDAKGKKIYRIRWSRADLHCGY